jgi:hypothetical protein
VHIIESICGLEFEEYEVDSLAVGLLSFIRNNEEFIKETIRGE